jgi:transcriptional regulator with XRE-family HTH domain
MKKPTDLSHAPSFKKPQNPRRRKRRSNAADSQLGESIRAHRLVAGMSQSDLAAKLGVSFQQVQKYEKGANRVGAGRIPLIAEIFGVPISALFKDHAQAASAIPTKLITDPTVVKLLTAYAEIKDRTVRRHVSELVDRIAKSVKKKSRRQ